MKISGSLNLMKPIRFAFMHSVYIRSRSFDWILFKSKFYFTRGQKIDKREAKLNNFIKVRFECKHYEASLETKMKNTKQEVLILKIKEDDEIIGLLWQWEINLKFPTTKYGCKCF